MEKIVLMILVLCVVVRAYRHPKFPHYPNEFRDNNLKKEKCSREKEDLRNEYIERSKCGKPKEVFVHLNSASTSELVIPKAVWVARCAGTCDYDGHECVATVKRTLHIPVRVSNISTGKESCSTYEVEEHVSCGCCSKRECEAPQIFNPPEPEYEVESI
ncbi:hypothetical protein JYU34_009948 [Plutella xylostella]|uniref:Platelet-derived growth factor (PDGF) family profile domain-containing protein n=1 Tax=Plutella xylostella TaxID=51655 RepID=A0ABQ7QKT5_PLUXY|nr:vascular endothelial growth factor B isoform X2 [Plutella xylostella]KAG7305802.1 hypothetical protein JYU34_009948 [Plutella xylostella]